MKIFGSGWVKDCKGGGLGRGWAGGWWCGYRHRSAKGATSPFGDRSPPNGISIHAPRRERLKSHPRLQEKYGFQSTLPRRERRSPVQNSAYSRPISIHAPAKGATLLAADICLDYCHFNPRSREGSDTARNARTCIFPHFNPRSREGRDYRKGVHKMETLLISIHAPAKGATRNTHPSSR